MLVLELHKSDSTRNAGNIPGACEHDNAGGVIRCPE
jgi:hypothetical protein